VRALIAAIVVLAVVAGGIYALAPRAHKHVVSACGPTDSTPDRIGAAAAGGATLCLLNRERTSRGLRPLAQNPLLAQAAQRHAVDMVVRAYFEHTSPDGTTVQDRIRATGYAGGSAASTGENIAWGVGAKATPAAMVATWMSSPPHRADILRPAFTEIGVGIAMGVPDVAGRRAGVGATYTTDFGGAFDPSLGSG
jgi:uncharacterized protein YkwD